MTYKIEEMKAFETQLVSGGVTMSADGKSCTDPRGDGLGGDLEPGLQEGGPEQVDTASIFGL